MKTYTEEDEEISILYQMSRFADYQENFDRKFVDKIYDFFEEKEYITEDQLEILNKMYEKNNVGNFFDEYWI